jgi:uncharacterized RDD family membrane protein YckC
MYQTALPHDPTDVIGRRIGAFAIDASIAIVAFVVLMLALPVTKDYARASAATAECDRINNDGSNSQFCVPANASVLIYEPGDLALVFGIPSAIWLVNAGLLTGLAGGSVGKLIVGLRVVRRSDGRRCGFWRGMLRGGMWIVDGAPWCFPVVALATGLSTKGHRRVGDMAAGTLVVAASSVGTRPIVPGLDGVGWPTAPPAGPWGQPQPWGAPPQTWAPQPPPWGAPATPPPPGSPPVGAPPVGAPPTGSPPPGTPLPWGQPQPWGAPVPAPTTWPAPPLPAPFPAPAPTDSPPATTPSGSAPVPTPSGPAPVAAPSGSWTMPAPGAPNSSPTTPHSSEPTGHRIDPTTVMPTVSGDLTAALPQVPSSHPTAPPTEPVEVTAAPPAPASAAAPPSPVPPASTTPAMPTPIVSPPPRGMPGVDAPLWDADRSTYIQWDPELSLWVQWDNATQRWFPIP